MRILLCFLLALVFVEAPAGAASEPIVAPAPEWVDAVPIPDPNPALGDRPYQNLLLSPQSRYGADHDDHFIEYAFVIQNPQGLQAAGNIILPWQPDQSELIVHKVRIVRGDEVIDLLANGQTFTVLRRESNLETAMLDGVLTAVMQPEGLSVGDIVNVAFTVRRRLGALGLRGENFFGVTRGFPIRRLRVRQIWPAGMAMRWRASDLFGEARTRITPLGTELLVELRDAEGPEPPAYAPGRFAMPATLQLSAYSSWGEISRALGPLYAEASELAANSPLRAHIDRIAAASADPRERVLAALRLVQDEVRYLALTMGEGHLRPASADQTWTRRYGDCKGKTALLLALLRGLGIEADPVAVHSRLGDGLDERLPHIDAFDHVIVRARIDGTSYWLDGTRTGDRSIAHLAAASFGWGLPIRQAGAELERIPVPSPDLPTVSFDITYDASRGFSDAVPVRSEITWRGETAAYMRAALSQTGRDAYLRQLGETDSGLEPAGADITDRELIEDADSDALVLVMTGTARMGWDRPSGNAVHEYRFDNSTISWDPETERKEGPFRDAPFAFNVPMHLASTETIILPDRGRGFTVEGTRFDRTIAGVRISRDVRIADGRAISRMVFRRLQREVPARELRAAERPLRAISDDSAFLLAPEGMEVQRAAADSVQGGAAGRDRAGDALDRGFRLLQDGDLEAAHAAFAEAAELAPHWSRPLANQAIVAIHRGDYEAAEAMLERAAAIGPADFVVPQGRGMIHLARGEAGLAAAQFTRSLELDPGNVFTLTQRSEAHRLAGRIDAALADLDTILAADPDHLGALVIKTRLLAWHGQIDRALALTDERIAADSDNVDFIHLRAAILERSGRDAEARHSYVRALELYDRRAAQDAGTASASLRSVLLAGAGQLDRAVALLGDALRQTPDDADLLNGRCWMRATANVELQAALADCDRALEIEPDRAAYLDSRALVRLRLGQHDAAIEDATAALAAAPQLAEAMFVRGVARIRSGDRGAGEADLAAARRIRFDIDAEYRSYGVTP